MVNNVNSYAKIQDNVDQGLRTYILRIYQYMATGLLLSCIAAFCVAEVNALKSLMFVKVYSPTYGAFVHKYSMFGSIIAFSPILIALYISYKRFEVSVKLAQNLFYAYSLLVGLSLGGICMVYTYTSIAATFLVCASLFGAMSIYGYVTQRNLASFGSFLMMGILGIVFAGIVNIFLKSALVNFVTSIIGVLVFTGMLAYDTQRIKLSYYSVLDKPYYQQFSIFCALEMYTNIINLFLYLLRFTGVFKGDRRD
jgi:FtsH-binding integral membrane protein